MQNKYIVREGNGIARIYSTLEEARERFNYVCKFAYDNVELYKINNDDVCICIDMKNSNLYNELLKLKTKFDDLIQKMCISNDIK